MFKIKKNQKGFTLIELLIVIAIIAILAAIAIPQFAAYRIKGFNGSAESDAKNWKTTEEAANSTFFSYGKSNTGNLLTPPLGTPGAGVLLTGALPGASTGGTGAMVNSKFYASRNPINLVDAGLGIGVGNNVILVADDIASTADADIADTALVKVKHLEGDTEFGVDTDSTALYWCKSASWVKKTLGNATYPANTPAKDDFAGNIACGGDAPMTTWIAL